jgi:hypothetical protein
MVVRELSTKATRSIILLLIAVLLVQTFCFLNLANAQDPSVHSSSDFIISIDNPIEGAVFNKNYVIVQTILKNGYFQLTGSFDSVDILYYLDGQLYSHGQSGINLNYSVSTTYGEFNLTGLPSGTHELKVGVHIVYSYAFAPSPRWEPKVSNATVHFTILTPTQKPTNQLTPTLTKAPMQTTLFSNLAMILSGVIAGTVIVSVALLIVYRKHSLKMKVDGDSTEKQ